jgi:hypothetical protein
MSETTANRRCRREIMRAETVILALAIVSCSVLVGNRLDALAARPTDFSACASFAVEWAQRREGLQQPIPRDQLIASMEKARSLGQVGDVARMAELLAGRDDLVMTMCAPSN